MSETNATINLGHIPGEGRSLGALARALADGRSLAEIDLDLSDPEKSRFGAYTLIHRIGAGGMGLVFRARQLSLERDVAIKILNMHLAGDDDASERLRTEARSAAALNHPNIVQVLEVGLVDTVAFIAMQLIRGESLEQRIQRERPAASTVVAWMLKLCDAVGYAHRLELLHLDLKPANVLIDERGEPMVADFGLARHMNSLGEVEAQEVSGSPGYMAPEQVLIRDFRLTTATDIYALGAILYEMLCGEPPHGRGEARDVMQRALAGQIAAPRALVPSVPKDLEAICMKCLSLRASDRYPNVAAIAEDLHRFQNGLEVSVRAPTLPERLQRWYAREPRFALALGAMLLLAIAGGLLMTRLYRQSEFERAGAEGLARLLMAQSSNDVQPILSRQHLQSKASDVQVPLIDCHEVNVNCGQGLDPFTNIDPRLPLEQRRHYLEALRVYVPKIRDWGNPRLSAQLSLKLDELAHSLYTMQRAHAAAAADTADGLVFGWLLARDIATTRQDKDDLRSWFGRALAKADKPWQVQTLAQSCDAADADCKLAIQRFRTIDPDNAAAWTLGLPKEPSSTSDALLLRAAGAAGVDNHHAEFLDAAFAFANRLMPTIDASMRVSSASFAMDAWNRMRPLIYPSGYCKRSYIERDAPAIMAACRTIFDKVTKAPRPMFLDENFSAVMAMHMSADPVVQAQAWQRVRNARWIYSAWAQLPPVADPEAATTAEFNIIRSQGELAYLKSLLTAAHLPLEAPAQFVTREPLPWMRNTSTPASPAK